MRLIKSTLAILLLLGVAGSGFYAGRKTAPKLWVIDLKASIAAQDAVWVPLNEPNGTRLFVASPDGAEPGVVAGHSKAGKSGAVLVVPPQLVEEYTAPAIQPQADHERLDHAGTTSHRLLPTARRD